MSDEQLYHRVVARNLAKEIQRRLEVVKEMQHSLKKINALKSRATWQKNIDAHQEQIKAIRKRLKAVVASIKKDIAK